MKLESTDKIIESMIEAVESNQDLQAKLKNAGHWKERWIELERFILDNLQKFRLDLHKYHTLWIRERVFYGMQEKTGLDYGFCQHFIPAFRNRTESILTDNLKIKMANKCRYGRETLETTCSGTDRDTCVVLHPEMSALRETPHKYN